MCRKSPSLEERLAGGGIGGDRLPIKEELEEPEEEEEDGEEKLDVVNLPSQFIKGSKSSGSAKIIAVNACMSLIRIGITGHLKGEFTDF